MLADREHAVLVVGGDLDLFEADLADRADREAIGAALDELLDHVEVEHDVAVEQDEAVVLDVLAAQQQRVRVVRACGSPGSITNVTSRLGNQLGDRVANHVLEVAGADHELVEAAAQQARDRAAQDRNAADRQAASSACRRSRDEAASHNPRRG